MKPLYKYLFYSNFQKFTRIRVFTGSLPSKSKRSACRQCVSLGWHDHQLCETNSEGKTPWKGEFKCKKQYSLKKTIIVKLKILKINISKMRIVVVFKSLAYYATFIHFLYSFWKFSPTKWVSCFFTGKSDIIH